LDVAVSGCWPVSFTFIWTTTTLSLFTDPFVFALGDDRCHFSSKHFSHAREITTVVSHDLLLTILAQGNSVHSQLTTIRKLMEFGLDVKWFHCIDIILNVIHNWTVLEDTFFVELTGENVRSALCVEVTFLEQMRSVFIIFAGCCRCYESICICFMKSPFRTLCFVLAPPIAVWNIFSVKP